MLNDKIYLCWATLKKSDTKTANIHASGGRIMIKYIYTFPSMRADKLR